MVPDILLQRAKIDEQEYRQFIENNEKRMKEAELKGKKEGLEIGKKEGLEIGAKKQLILNAFSLFKAGFDLKALIFLIENKKFTSEEVNSALENYIIEDGRENDKDRFISYLKNKQFIK